MGQAHFKALDIGQRLRPMKSPPSRDLYFNNNNRNKHIIYDVLSGR